MCFTSSCLDQRQTLWPYMNSLATHLLSDHTNPSSQQSGRWPVCPAVYLPCPVHYSRLSPDRGAEAASDRSGHHPVHNIAAHRPTLPDRPISVATTSDLRPPATSAVMRWTLTVAAASPKSHREPQSASIEAISEANSTFNGRPKKTATANQG